MQARVKGMIGDELDLVEAELTRGGHMAGAEFSATDVQMMFPLEFAAFARLVDARHAELRDYLARMQARPAYRRAVDSGGAYAFVGRGNGAASCALTASEDRAAPPSAA
jgi:glutathione S-transferase